MIDRTVNRRQVGHGNFRLLMEPEARETLFKPRLTKWVEPLCACITIYMVHRYEGGRESHDFKFVDDSGARVIVSVVFTRVYANIVRVREEDSSTAA